MQRLAVDVSGALDSTLGSGRGIPAAAYEGEVARLADLAAWMDAERAAGRADWFDVPVDEDPATEVRAWRAAAPAVDDVIVDFWCSGARR